MRANRNSTELRLWRSLFDRGRDLGRPQRLRLAPSQRTNWVLGLAPLLLVLFLLLQWIF
jgi:hypothetical protein